MPFWRKRSHSSGVDNYRQVERLLERGKEIYIVSPYIDPYYASMIRKYANRKRFYIISSSLDAKARRILESRGSWLSVIIFALFVVAISIVLLALSLLSMAIMLIAALAIAARIVVFKAFARNRIRLKVPGRFVHAKMYISERMAISGSANLTYKGMHSNVEHIDIAYDPKEILEFKKEFWRIWNS
jgi:phosphatidylserine/phosphatidylglycerophosphate/cardiolipin synthase-like enzyme